LVSISSKTTSQQGLRALVLLIAVSVPIWLGLETLLRVYVLRPMYGPLIAQLRELYWPELTAEVLADRSTRFAWMLLVVTVLAGILGVVVLRLVTKRGGQGAAPERKLRDRLLLMTSIPQVPGLLATLCPPAGAAWTPVLLCVGVSTVFVIVQGHVGERLLAEMRASPT
jgi:hypothetical protein